MNHTIFSRVRRGSLTFIAASLLVGCALWRPRDGDANPYVGQITPPSSVNAVAETLQSKVTSFSGLSVAADGGLQVRLVDLRQSGTARLALLVLMEADGPLSAFRGRPIVFLPAILTYQDLGTAKRKMRDVLAVPGVVWLDLDEACGCIAVGVRDSAVEAHVRAFASANAVDQNSVRVVTTTPIRALADLRDGMRPAKGGLQIEFSGGICTLGLPVFHNMLTKKGLLTASHCTDGARGGVSGTWIAQPGGALFWGDKIGEEQVDPYLFVAAQDPDCPAGRRCRRSDAAFAQFDLSTNGVVGRLARPRQMCLNTEQICNTQMDSQSDEIRITGLAPPPMVGDLRSKIGRTTGWTRGAITRTCVDTNVSNDDDSDSGITMLCQIFVGGASDHGDSGSPVFFYRAQDNTALFDGILWGGGGTPDDHEWVYSPPSGIVSELGSISFY